MSLLADNIKYSKVGSGPHLCFLHGFCEDSSIWDYQIKQLQKEYTCIAIDLPGFGASINKPFTTIPEVTGLIHEVLVNEEATDCILLGHSLGGYIVGEYLSHYGQELSAAGIVHSSLDGDSETKKANRKKSIDFISSHGTSEFFRLFIKGLVALPNLGRLRSGLEEMIVRNKQKSVLTGLSAMSIRKSTANELLHFKKPVLFIIGEEDTHYSHRDILSQAAKCDLVQVTKIQDVGHLSMLEKPQENLQALQKFLLFVDYLSVTS